MIGNWSISDIKNKIIKGNDFKVGDHYYYRSEQAEYYLKIQDVSDKRVSLHILTIYAYTGRKERNVTMHKSALKKLFKTFKHQKL